jgi:hypothetical protein
MEDLDFISHNNNDRMFPYLPPPPSPNRSHTDLRSTTLDILQEERNAVSLLRDTIDHRRPRWFLSGTLESQINSMIEYLQEWAPRDLQAGPMISIEPGMVNGRSITGRLSVGLPKREIRRPIGSGRLETEWGPMPTGFSLVFVGLHRRWPDQEPIY